MEARRIYPFLHEPDRFLVLALATSFEGINAAAVDIATQMLGLTVALLVATTLLAIGLARRIIRPLSELTSAAREIEHTNRTDFPQAARNDEIGTLGGALQTMVTALEEQRRQLETANVDLEYFARIASHDLREPARRMALLANLLQMQEHERISQDSRDTLQKIREEGLRMVEQLTELRAFSRLGQEALQREPTDIRAMIEFLLEERREAIAARRIKTIVEPMPEVPVYRSLVELLYGNLIENALHHAQGNGWVLMFTCHEVGDRIVFGVSNTGSTITTEPDMIFEPFRSTGDLQEHSGLGLSICRRIVERHTGQIWVEFDAHHVHFMFTFAEPAT
jgi:signal transduction histidine kinase